MNLNENDQVEMILTYELAERAAQILQFVSKLDRLAAIKQALMFTHWILTTTRTQDYQRSNNPCFVFQSCSGTDTLEQIQHNVKDSEIYQLACSIIQEFYGGDDSY